jgi:hydrogenase nickel incorporation protein HypB
MKKVEVKSAVLKENDRIAQELRARFNEEAILAVNLISSPGSGKTSLLEETLSRFRGNVHAAVLTGDVQTDNDARRLARFGFPTKQICTAGACHLNAAMIRDHIADWDLASIDILLIENVGNLICPTSYDLGEHAKIVLLSVTEGEDKPLKYPGIFSKSSAMVLNKMDLLPHVPFDKDAAIANARSLNSQIAVMQTAGTTGEGISQWIAWLEDTRTRLQDKQPLYSPV